MPELAHKRQLTSTVGLRAPLGVSIRILLNPKNLREKCVGKSIWALADCEWHAVATGLKPAGPLHLPRAPLLPCWPQLRIWACPYVSLCSSYVGLVTRTSSQSPGPLEWARAETGGADQWVLKRKELAGFALVNEIIWPGLDFCKSLQQPSDFCHFLSKKDSLPEWLMTLRCLKCRHRISRFVFPNLRHC